MNKQPYARLNFVNTISPKGKYTPNNFFSNTSVFFKKKKI